MESADQSLRKSRGQLERERQRGGFPTPGPTAPPWGRLGRQMNKSRLQKEETHQDACRRAVWTSHWGQRLGSCLGVREPPACPAPRDSPVRLRPPSRTRRSAPWNRSLSSCPSPAVEAGSGHGRLQPPVPPPTLFSPLSEPKGLAETASMFISTSRGCTGAEVLPARAFLHWSGLFNLSG